MPTSDLDLFRSVHNDDLRDGVIVDSHAVAGVLSPSMELPACGLGKRESAPGMPPYEQLIGGH